MCRKWHELNLCRQSQSLKVLLLVQWTPVLITHFTHSGVIAHGKGFKSATPGDRHHYISRAVILCCKTRQPWKYTHTLKSLKVKDCNTPLLGTRRHSRMFECIEKIKKVIRYCCWNLKFSIIFGFKHTFWLSCKWHVFPSLIVYQYLSQQNLQACEKC